MRVSDRPKGKHLLTCYVAGFQFYSGEKIETRLDHGVSLRIRPEDNTYDPYALAIYYEKLKLGYIPQDINRWLLRTLEEGKDFQVVIHEVNVKAPSWERVVIDVFEEV